MKKRGEPARKVRVARAAETFTLASEASRQLGLTLRELWDICQRRQFQVHRGVHEDYLKASDVAALRTRLLENGHHIEVRVIARMHNVETTFVRKAAANLRLTTDRNSAGREVVRFGDYAALLTELDVVLVVRENQQLDSLGTRWDSDGAPLKRHEDTKKILKKPRKTVQYVQVVAGGLPTLGSGHK